MSTAQRYWDLKISSASFYCQVMRKKRHLIDSNDEVSLKPGTQSTHLICKKKSSLRQVRFNLQNLASHHYV